MNRKTSFLKGLALLLLGLLLLHGVRHHVVQTFHPFPVEYGEGVTLNWAQRLHTGAPLYPAITESEFPQIHNPYPPLFPLAQSLLARITSYDAPFVPGRLISLLSTLAAALMVGALVRRRASAGTAGIAACMFLLSPMLMRFGSMARVDPLGLALSFAAVLCLDRGQTPKHLAAAAVLCAGALLVKPTFIAAPLFLLCHLCSHRNARNIAVTLLAGIVPLLLTGLWLWQREYPQLLLHLWTLQGLPADFAGAFSWFATFAGTHAPVIALGVLWMCTEPATDRLRLYACLTLIAPLLTAHITGSQENYLMETWAVLCVGAATLWNAQCERAPKHAVVWIGLMAQLALFLPVAPAPVFTRTYGQELPPGSRSAWTPTQVDREIGQLLREELASMTGPMLSADPGYLLLVQENLQYQPFQFERLGKAGQWSPGHLQEQIREGHFTLILLKGLAETGEDGMFTQDTQSLIHEHYELHRVLGPWHLYRQAW
ncbi:MAG: glycosyltransferase family 39 protein [Verrucomicrobia bacterium]|nr:glycosyltransferase family 39 protein [Verrucomicrobiota bacterium]MCH8513128.1 glycosyltransferase family 39 protein [Kiritimatiellia bacterium]